MFGKIIKDIRKEKGLTQKELAVKLALSSVEFASIDFVTVSRWELGKTKPNIAKSIRVIRCLSNDIGPYLEWIQCSSLSDSFEEYLYEFYDSVYHRAILAAVGKNDLNSVNIESCKLSLSPKDNDLDKLILFDSQLNDGSSGLTSKDLYLYQETNRMYCNKIVDRNDKYVTLGHSIAFFFDCEYINGNFNNNENTIDLDKSVRYQSNVRLAMYLYSCNSLSSSIFKLNWGKVLSYLSIHANITDFYINVSTDLEAKYFSSLGFKIVSCSRPVKYGGIRLGGLRFEKCVYKIDTSKLLSDNDSIFLVKNS